MLIRTVRLTKGWEAPSRTLILPISCPGAEPLISQLTDDKSAHKTSGIAKVTFCLTEYEGAQRLTASSLTIRFYERWTVNFEGPVLFQINLVFWSKSGLPLLWAHCERGEPGTVFTKGFSGEQRLRKT